MSAWKSNKIYCMPWVSMKMVTTDIVFVAQIKLLQNFLNTSQNNLFRCNGNAVENNELILSMSKKNKQKQKMVKKEIYHFLLEKKQDKHITLAPIRGKGLWDAIWGYVAMDEEHGYSRCLF